ncbi:30S ribosomal protein S8 [Patescibacteria group bacterium]|nr:30S ribosomal protein S8 [Patescibacteria group bacterium]
MHLVSDLIVRIKTANIANKKVTYAPFSNLLKSILRVLKNHKYIKDFKVFKKGNIKQIKIYLDIENKPINDLKVVSKPGSRIYLNCLQLKKRKSNLGIIIVSTSKGVCTTKEAIKLGSGGEVLLKIW